MVAPRSWPGSGAAAILPSPTGGCVLRLIVLLVAAGAAAIWIEPRWMASERTLVLRLRSSDELVGAVRARSRALGREAADRIGERIRLPDVASRDEEAEPAERISPDEQRRLDRLIEEKLRED